MSRSKHYCDTRELSVAETDSRVAAERQTHTHTQTPRWCGLPLLAGPGELDTVKVAWCGGGGTNV